VCICVFLYLNRALITLDIIYCFVNMGLTKDISNEKAAQVKILIQEQLSLRQIASRCNISKSSVQRIKAEVTKCGLYKSKRSGRCGRKSLTTAQDERMMVRNIRSDPLTTATDVRNELAARGTTISVRTVQKKLNKLGCRSVKTRKVPKLTPRMKKQRLHFAQLHRHWTADDWKRVSCFFYAFSQT